MGQCLWGSGDVALVENILGVLSMTPLAPPFTGAALTPAKPQISVPLHPAYRWLVCTGDRAGDASSPLHHEETLISLALPGSGGEGAVQASASARCFLIKFEFDVNRGLWAKGLRNCHGIAPPPQPRPLGPVDRGQRNPAAMGRG